jgi:hypothetical protein
MIVVAAPPGRALELMRPFPIVRIVGRLTRSGARIRLLAVRSAPRGAKVTVRCRGRQCGRLRTASKVLTSGSTRFRSYQRRVRAGARIQVYVTQAGKIGKYTRFLIRAGKPPARVDRCLMPGRARPVPCA